MYASHHCKSCTNCCHASSRCVCVCVCGQGEIADAIRLQTAQHRQVMSQICAKYGVASTAELPAHVAVFRYDLVLSSSVPCLSFSLLKLRNLPVFENRLHIIKGDYEYKDAFEWDLMADFSAVQLFADVVRTCGLLNSVHPCNLFLSACHTVDML